jgi:drug/metabolite transporter (DMT)-like permease
MNPEQQVPPAAEDGHAVLVLLLGAGLISFSPILVKLGVLEGVGTTAIGFWRNLGGGLVLFGVAAARRRSWRLPSRALLYAAISGVAFCVDLFAWHRSIVYAGAGLSTILANTQVFAAAVVSYFVFKERLTFPFIVAASVAFIGVAFLVGIGSEEVALTGTYARGVVYGLVTGIAYAGFVVSLKKGQMGAPKPDPITFVAWSSLFSAIFLGVLGWMEGSEFVPRTPTAYLSLAGLSFLVQAVGWLAISGALPRVVTAQAGLILLLQPILATVWGILFYDEYLKPLQIVGAAITLVAMYFGITQRKQPTNRSGYSA